MSKLKASTIIKAINTGIELNPSHVTFEVTRKELVEGAFEDIHEEIEADIVFYFSYNQQMAKPYLDVQGEALESPKYKGYINNTVNLKADQHTKIEFKDILGNKFSVRSVYPFIIEDTYCGAELEIIKID